MTDNHSNQNEDAMNDPEIAALYRSTREEEPDSSLDDRILAQARLTARRRRNRWLLPLSSAAVVMLGLTLTLKLLEQEPTLPTVEDFAVDEVAEPMGVPQRSMREKKEQAIAPGKMEMGVSPTKEKRDSEVRLQKIVPAEESAKPTAADSASAPATEKPMGVIEEEQLRQRSDVVESVPAEDEEIWLARIMGMVDAGNADMATDELVRFMERYPEYPVPDSLQYLLMDEDH